MLCVIVSSPIPEWRHRYRGSSGRLWVFPVWWSAHACWHARCAAAVDGDTGANADDETPTNNTISMTTTTPTSAHARVVRPLPVCTRVSIHSSAFDRCKGSRKLLFLLCNRYVGDKIKFEGSLQSLYMRRKTLLACNGLRLQRQWNGTASLQWLVSGVADFSRERTWQVFFFCTVLNAIMQQRPMCQLSSVQLTVATCKTATDMYMCYEN